jgi:alpha-tubulin suppressor-like RCC1 family protein
MNERRWVRVHRVLSALIMVVGVVLVAPPAAQASNGGVTPRAIGNQARLSVGWGYSCAVVSEGKVSCWGGGDYGRLGYGGTANIGDDETPQAITPMAMPDDAKAVSLASGLNFACALVDTGDVVCWGLGFNGALGNGSSDNIGDDETIAAGATAVALPGGLKATSIAAGYAHVCAILTSGAVSCWGEGTDGALGYGNTDRIGDDESVASAGTVALPGGQSAIAISAGGSNSCAILASGDVTCWGDGGYAGQLGYGNSNDIGDNETPAANPINGGLVPLPGGAHAVAIATGQHHTCAILSNDGVSCWGFANGGQLGYGNTNNMGDTETPADNPVNNGLVPIPTASKPVAITAGTGHTCLLFADGTVSCWGTNNYGELGYGNTSWYGDTNFVTSAPNGGIVSLPGSQPAVAISAGWESTCAALRDGNVTCWGKGDSGRLGYGNLNDIGDNETPATNPVNGGIVRLPGGRDVAQVEAGYFSSCAVLTDGHVTCWGDSDNGELGFGNTNAIGDDEYPRTNPVNGGIVPLPGGATAASVTIGAVHACALLTTGNVSCWGYGGQGALGYGNTNAIGNNETVAANPVNGGIVPMPGARQVVKVEAGYSHTCALLADGNITCWGTNDNGELGYGNTDMIGDNETPATNVVNGGLVALPGGRKAVDIAAGESMTCALLDNGTATCWGAGSFGRLGYGNTNDIGDNETPAANPVNGGIVPMPAGRTVRRLAAGSTNACAVLDNLTLTCWGYGAQGVLGYGNTNTIGDNETPATNLVNGGLVHLPGEAAVVDVGVGISHTCALLVGGVVSCWGRNYAGQLGSGNGDIIGDDEEPADNAVNGGVVPMPVGRTVRALEVGNLHNCVLLTGADVMCWGDGLDGELGYGNTTRIGLTDTPDANPVNGAIVPLTQTVTGADYRPLQPARLLDTRPTGVTIDGLQQQSGQVAAGGTVELTVRGRGGVTPDSAAVTLSIAAVQPAGGGYLTVWPCGNTMPLASSLNYASGVNTANTVVSRIPANGKVCIFTSHATQLIADVVGTVPLTSSLTPVDPARLADTRANGATIDDQFEKGGKVTSATPLTLAIAGRGGVPAGARTVLLNVAAVSPNAGGFITVHPCVTPRPNASNLNYITGVNTANLVVVPLNASGEACFYSSQTTHLIVDVVGYYDNSTAGTSQIDTANPARLADTRATGVTVDGRGQATGVVTAGSTISVQVTNRFPSGNATMAVLNVTAVSPASGGYLTVWACDATQPTASSLNYIAGVNRAVQVFAPLSADGSVCIYTSKNTHLIVDVTATSL